MREGDGEKKKTDTAINCHHTMLNLFHNVLELELYYKYKLDYNKKEN